MLEQNFNYLTKALTIKKTTPASVLLILTGALFGLLWIADIIPALLSGLPPQSIVTAGLWVNPIHVIDLSLVLPGMIVTGILLFRKKPTGFIFAAPWLTFSVLMGSSIEANMVLELNNGNTNAVAPFILIGLIVLASIIVLYHYLK